MRFECTIAVARWIQTGFSSCLTILCVFSIEVGYTQSEYRFHHYDIGDGLASDNAGGLVQDSLGFIWVQSPGGLCRFDGYNFKIYKNDADNPEKSIDNHPWSGLMKDPAGNLWRTPGYQYPYYLLAKYNTKTDGFIKYNLEFPDGSGYVRRVCFERNGTTLWFPCRTGLFSFSPETNEFRRFVNFKGDSVASLDRNDIMDVIDRDSVLLIATARGLWMFDKAQKTFLRPPTNPKDSAFLHNAFVSNFFERTLNGSVELWILYNDGLAQVDESFSVVHRFDLPPEMSGTYAISVNGFASDSTGFFWLATGGNGLCRYNPVDTSFICIKSNPQDPYALRSDYLNYVIVDRDQNVWVSSNHGISCLSRQSLRFYNSTISDGTLQASLLHEIDGKDFVIMAKGKQDGTQEVTMASLTPDHLDQLQFDEITSFKGYAVRDFSKGRKNLWFVWGAGLGSLPLNPKSGMIESEPLKIFEWDPNNPLTYSLLHTSSVWEDKEENVWVGARFGLIKIISGNPYATKSSIIPFTHEDADSTSIGHDEILGIVPEGQKSIWVITGIGVDLYSGKGFEHVFKNKETPYAVHRSSDSTLYIGTSSGLYEGIKHAGEYRFNKTSLLKNSHILTIGEDQGGRLWISTMLGIVCYSPKDKVAIEFNRKDGLVHYRNTRSSDNSHVANNGIMVFSDQDGFSCFDPMSLRISNAKTFPVLTRLTVNNTVPDIGTKQKEGNKFFITRDISVLQNLVLDYQHNNFSIEFSSMEMTAPEKNLYRHKLEGYDMDWIETDWKNRIATYTNLDAGKYLLKVMVSNHHGIWSDQETTLVVSILPPPWKTWWAYTLYGLALVGIFLSWRTYDIKRVKLKHRAEHLSELDNLKSRFFANISHEFRTPITLLLGPLKDLYNKANSDDQKTVLATMMRNGQRLMRLINQLLDLSKLEAGKMTMQASKTDLVQFLKEIASSYESLAADKKIKYFFYPEVLELNVYLDHEKIEKVMHNILSNAFKFTKENGEVILYLKVDDNQNAVISVKDTGIGIPDSQLNKVFDRFYQVDSSQTRGYEGSGIGMALAKELVELHNGTISVESKDGKGSTFTVRLPLDQKYLRKEEMMDSGDLKERGKVSHEIIDEDTRTETSEEKETVSESQPVLLVVEDNADMRNYIRKTLSDTYQIIEAVNGKEGVEKGREVVPDLIISDVMMPGMDGYKLCELIKTNEFTSHIPVILLTAKADQQSKLTGLEHRADDYLVKPFDGDELKLIVRNHIEQRQKMRERFSREITLEPTQISVSSLDEKFLKK